MKTKVTAQKLGVEAICFFMSVCTNDLVINAKQVNYFEMFMLSTVVELKNAIQSNISISMDNWNSITIVKNDIMKFNQLALNFVKEIK